MRIVAGILASCIGAVLMAQPAEPMAAPRVEIVTNVGAMTVELWPEKAPQTVDNFLKLVDEGFYEGTIFHRVIAGFMIQGGGYEADMTYRTAPRKVVNESIDGARNHRWTIAMARHADPDSADSQFYINLVDNTYLDAQEGQPGYTVFGQLIAGRDVAETIELKDTGTVKGSPNVPLEAIVIQAARRLGATDGE